MARPPRHNVDYFPHYISDGKKMFIIETKFGNDGYATWFKILETLAKSDDHWCDLSDRSNLMFLSAKCRVSENLLCEIIGTLADLGEVDRDLWEHERVVWSDKFMESVADAYGKRSNEPPTKQGLVDRLRGLGRCKPPKFPKKGDVNPQSIVEETKVEETKEEAAPAPSHKLVLWIAETCPRVAKMKKPLTSEQAEKLQADLSIKTKEQGQAIKDVIMAMENYAKLGNYISAYMTIRKWYERELPKLQEKQEPWRPKDPTH